MAEESTSPFKYFPLIMLILAIQNGIVYYLLDKAIPKPDVGAVEKTQEEMTVEEVRKPQTLIVKGIEAVTVTPAGDQLGHLVQIAVQLGVDSPSTKRKVMENTARVQDSVTRALAPRNLEQLRAPARDDTKKAIREELNKWLGGHVVEIYFTKYIIQ